VNLAGLSARILSRRDYGEFLSAGAGVYAAFAFSWRRLSGTILNEFFRRHEEYFRKFFGDRLAYFPASGLIVAGPGGGYSDLCANFALGKT
jgi:hypothetical protein